MNISGAQSATIKTLLQGVVIGAVVLVIGGQFWPGYMLDSNAKADAEQARQTAVDQSATLMCAEIYKSEPDGKAKLAALRKIESYQVGQDAGVAAASKEAVKIFTEAKISPVPNGYRVKSDCGDMLHKPEPAKAADLKK